MAFPLNPALLREGNIGMNTLKQGDAIGIISPSGVAEPELYEKYVFGLEALGFKVKLGKNIYKDTYHYTASAQERSDDFNEMIYDDAVKMVFFDGGCGSVELIPYIDYEQIRKMPKLIASYSDGTSILNAIYTQTGVTTYYGSTPWLFDHLSEYDKQQFVSHFVEGNVKNYVANSPWHAIIPGKCQGRLIGGFLLNFALGLGNPYFVYSMENDYILFIETFQSEQDVNMLLSCISQSTLMNKITGLLFGHYTDEISLPLFEILKRFGDKHHIPVAYCDDFGHGVNHAILPIGSEAFMDTERKTLMFR